MVGSVVQLPKKWGSEVFGEEPGMYGLAGVGVAMAEEHPLSLFEESEDSASDPPSSPDCHLNDPTHLIDQHEYESYFNC